MSFAPLASLPTSKDIRPCLDNAAKATQYAIEFIPVAVVQAKDNMQLSYRMKDEVSKRGGRFKKKPKN
jgi:hypothetical protein